MVSLGEELKRERELREISLREISDATKISVRILDAIEHDNYKILPGGVFNRNFLRAYAGFIGLDPENVVRKYEQQASRHSEEEPAGIGMAPEDAVARSRSRKKLLLLAIGLVILIVLSIILISRRPWTGSQAPVGQPSGKLAVPGIE